MFRKARGLFALIGLLAIVFVVPIVLLSISSLDGLSRIANLGSPDDGTLLVALLTLIAWIAWAVVVATVVFESLSLFTRGRIRVTLPGTGWFRPLIASMLIAVGGLMATQAPLAAATEPSSEPTVSAEVTPEPASESVVEQSEVEDTTSLRYRVADGDDLWTLAERFYGEGAQWRKLADANPWLDPARPLEAGTILVVPDVDNQPAAVSQAPASPTDAPSQAPATTQPAAQLEQILPSLPEMASAAEPQKLAPSQDESPTSGETPTQPHTVKAGDTLWDLAEESLGDPTRWPELYQLNQDQVSDPDHIEVGWELNVPDTESAPANPRATPGAPDPRPVGEPNPAPPTQEPTTTRVSPISEDGQPGNLGVVAAVGGTLAAGLLGALNRQRILQLVGRNLGRKVPVPSVDALRVEQALALRTQEEAPSATPMPPTQVVLGWAGDEPVTLDLEESSFTALSGDAEAVLGSLAAISSSLVCADWSQDVEVQIIGHPESWLDHLDDPRVTHCLDTTEGIERLVRLAAQRRDALGDEALADVRNDPDRADSWQPVVFIFCDVMAPSDIDLVRLELAGDIGVSVVATAEEPQPTTNVAFIADRATLDGESFSPQLLGVPARRALIDLMSTASSTQTTPAPWWSHEGDLPPNVTPLNRAGEREEAPMPALTAQTVRYPTLLMLGPVELIGTTGELPNRAVKQCQEYCAWILANPGSTSTKMADDLVVAEATRRSNMSRLRTWLGSNDQGEAYLPDAYSGRIELHPDVTSDWEHFCMAITGGVDRATTGALQQALSYVRGAPLADAAPWQWVWAETLRSDMISAIRDAGVVLAERAVELNDIELAHWAIARAEAAAPQDEMLMATKVLVYNAQGDAEEVKRLVIRLTRASRDSGVDLSDRTVAILQRVMEGQRRAQQI